jgi:hypothetical protein
MEAHVKHLFGNICRASVAAAGVMVATSAASAETRPVQFETEFDLDLSLNGAALEIPAAAPQAAAPVALEISKAVDGWEQAIGAYLDALLESDAKVEAKAEAPAEPTPAANEVIAAEVAAFAAPAVTVKPELLAPVLSQPMHCEGCLLHAPEKPAETAAVTAPAPAPVATVDDDAAWQSLAVWAAERTSDDAEDLTDTAFAAEAEFFADFDAAENEPTE